MASSKLYPLGIPQSGVHPPITSCQWAALREAARLKVNPAKLESLVKETETLLETGEFKALSILDDQPVNAAEPPKPVRLPVKPPTGAVPAPKPIPRTDHNPTLKLPSRALSRPPFMQQPPAPSEEIKALATAKVELEQQTKLLESLKADLAARESFVSESENLLLQKTLAQQEQEAELEQRSEELQHVEQRIRLLKSELDPNAPDKTPAASSRVLNEFSE